MAIHCLLYFTIILAVPLKSENRNSGRNCISFDSSMSKRSSFCRHRTEYDSSLNAAKTAHGID